MEQVLLALGDALAPKAILFVFLGVLLGYVIGVLPGLNCPAALAIAIPLSYYMTPLTAVAFLIGIAKASGAGGATTAVLINVPGEPNAAVTCLDGYPLARNGKAKLALETALYGSVIGDVIGTLALIALAHPLAKFALGIGPLEMTALMLLALTFIATLAGDLLLRGLAAGIFGVFLATVGLDIESGTPRMTFGYTELLDGIPLLAVTVGMLGLSEMVIQAEELLSRSPTESAVRGACRHEGRRLRLAYTSLSLPDIPAFEHHRHCDRAHSRPRAQRRLLRLLWSRQTFCAARRGVRQG